MSITRTQKREKSEAIQLFNKLFFEFVNYLNAHSQMLEGYLHVENSTWNLLQRLDKKWKMFCHDVKNNPKKRLNYKVEYFMEEVNKHIDRLNKSAWEKYDKSLIEKDDLFPISQEQIDQFYELKLSPDQAVLKHYINNLENYMHTIEIPDIKFKTEIPAGIEEMNRKQYLMYAGLLAKLLSKDISMETFKTSMVFTFMKIRSDKKKYEKLAGEAKFDISANVYKIAELLDYFFTIEDDKIKVNLSWTKSFIRSIHRWIHFYYGPVDALTDITFLEYKDANSFYRKYSETQDEADLNRLIAVLYRPRIMGHKFKYNPAKIEKRAQRIGKMPYDIRFGIFLFYTACEEFLRVGSFKADGNTINLEILYTVTAKEKKLADKVKHKDETGLTGLANSLAKTGIYGTVDKVYSQNLYDVLILLYQQRIEYLNQLETMDIK